MRCCTCKRELPKSAFVPSDRYRCRECRNARQREGYRRRHPENTWMNTRGQWVKREGRWPSVLWTGNMLSLLKRHFPTTRNRELAELIGVGLWVLKKKAKELGLKKDKEWVRSIRRESGYLGYYESKRKRGT